MSWVWKYSKAKGNERLVLLAIADRCDDEGRNAWPSVRSLVDKTLLSERTVQSCVRRLTDLGELLVQPAGGPRGTNLYVVTMTPAESAPPQNPHPADCVAEGCEICGVRGADSAPNTSSTSKNHPTAGAAAVEPVKAEPTLTQRSKAITDAYSKIVPLSKWVAVNGIVHLALKTGRYTDSEIQAAVLRLAEQGRSVTVEALRVELEGLPPPTRPTQQSRNSTVLAASMARAQAAEQAGAPR